MWFDRGRFDHRLGGLLLALATVDEVVRQVQLQAGRQSSANVYSVADLSVLVRPLISLTERALTEDERAARRLGDNASTLGWTGPTAIPDLALFALIKLKREAFSLCYPSNAAVGFVT
ncbi:hypothetical protein [Nannocystis pusilla]|uniref:hypothetical protein n=1 Tax=Nannocystis pusilla TaxID=889268 RepID=UPI003B7A825F